MLRLHVIGTGSMGNAYLLMDEDGKALLLDAGLQNRRIDKAIYQTGAEVLACLVTHEHGDHCAAVPMMEWRGIKCYGTRGTCKAVGHMLPIEPYDPTIEMSGQDIKQFGPFRVLAFRTNHDAAEPCGFLITHAQTGEKMVYATDTYYIAYRFPGINYWLIECNYCDQMVVDAEITNPVLARRLYQSHMSLDRLCQLFQANDLKSCRQIILCHISRDRGDAQEMVNRIHFVTRKPTAVAEAGKTYELSTNPF